MADSWGDGWNGNAIEIYEDGVLMVLTQLLCKWLFNTADTACVNDGML